MAEQLLTEQPPAPDTNHTFCSEFDTLPVPPLDPLFLPGSDYTTNDNLKADLGFGFEEDGDIELTFDDLDDLYFPSETEPFIIPVSAQAKSSQGCSGNFNPESGGFGISGDHSVDVVDSYMNWWSPESVSCDRGYPKVQSSQDSGDGCPEATTSMNFPSPASSHGSGVSEAVNTSSADSRNPVVDEKIKVKEIGKNSVTKRKKDSEDATGESRTNKFRRSFVPSENTNSDEVSVTTNEEEEKRKARLMRNRESAQLSRQRKKHYVEELEDKVRTMHSTIADLNSKISYFMAENATLRQQLSGGAGICPPPPGMYSPMAPMPYPWMPCPPYVVKSQGSQVPLVPIPRLKPQQPVSASKPKKGESKKGVSRTKKVASISFLGLLFFIVLFGGLIPVINVKYGGTYDNVDIVSGYVNDRFYDQHRGRVLTVSSQSNGSDKNIGIGFSKVNFDTSNRIHYKRGHSGGSSDGADPEDGRSSSKENVPLGNSSESLVASLYVPRNDKLVKIDGNLIIHSVLASEKAMASRKDNRETGLAIPTALAIPDVRRSGRIHSHLYRSANERQKALSSGSTNTLKDHFKSSAADGKLQQWFREGVAGNFGVLILTLEFGLPVQMAGNKVNKGRNGRVLRHKHLPLKGSNLNITEDGMQPSAQKDNFPGNKSASSMVVSILVDPREAGDADIDGMIAPKSLSRIFVVVLMDSVKYVTYSCVLPRSSPHLVTA
ncbi:bZIP transcription factor 17-like [Carica papaya]|uniref:bZIP transcription factor 17-like n=1 Tax=Carica papaya TaxID=3649 RepID=UPI000B8CC745|nr:bZIP transcription factor 17-like [Carica papaya]